MKIDKNTIIGLILMALVMGGYMWYQNTTAKKMQEQRAIEAQTEAIAQHKSDSIESVQKEKKAKKQINDSTSSLFQARQQNDGQTVLENELLKITIANKGGQIARAELKDPTYKDQKGKQVVLFDNNESNMRLLFDGKEDNIVTDELYFTPKNASKSSVTMSLPIADGSIDIMYKLVPNSYILEMSVKANNLQGFFPTKTKSFDIEWSENMRQQEKGFEFENRYSTITWRTTNNDTDELSSAGADKEEDNFKDNLQWVAFKTQFFSQILIADSEFKPSSFKQKQFKKEEQKDIKYLKNYVAEMSTDFDPSGKSVSQMKMYLGPNKFSTLRNNEKLCNDERDLDLQSIVYLGWPLIKYINRFFMLYLFDWMTSWGINMGIVLIILTLLIKCAVFPLMRKSFLSSARMRVLKPKVDELAKKYPNKEDAMKKQQETMQLYSQYGVSPMGGCLPMLIQMPIWIALFNFIPNAIELRGQSFLWADDLSTYDDVINWGTNIPFIGNHISLFCVLWCISTIVNTWITMRQQKDTMTSEQAQQMKMMQWMSYIMPVVFFFSFNDYSSGLNLYYFFSGLLSILMMWFLRKTTNDDKLLAKLEKRYQERKANGTGINKTSSMMGRLQALAEKQQEMLRQQQEEQQKRNKK